MENQYISDMTQEEFFKACDDVMTSITEKYKADLTKAMERGAFEPEEMTDNYYNIYPVLAAYLQREVDSMLNGSCSETRNKAMRKEFNKLRAYL